MRTLYILPLDSPVYISWYWVPILAAAHYNYCMAGTLNMLTCHHHPCVDFMRLLVRQDKAIRLRDVYHFNLLV